MKSIFAVSLLFRLSGLIHTLPSSDSDMPNLAPFLGDLENVDHELVIKDTYLVKLKPGVSIADHDDSFLASFDSENDKAAVLHKYDITEEYQGYAIEITDKAVLQELRGHGDIEFVEFDQPCSLSSSQSGAPWNLARISQRSLPVSNYYKYDNEAGQNVNVYIFDTGIRTTHQQFGGRAVWGASFTGETFKTDMNGHGTHVAATVAGISTGVAKKATVIAVQVLDKSGSGRWSWVLSALEWAYKQHISHTKDSVINMSISGSKSSSLNYAIRGTVKNGMHVVVAAGNEATDACERSPASEAYAITVGAIGSSDSMSSFSNYGRCVDTFAPGESIVSAYHTSDSAYVYMSGTSMASPHVAGVKALLLSAKRYTVYGLDTFLNSIATKNAIRNLRGDTINALLYNAPPSSLTEDEDQIEVSPKIELDDGGDTETPEKPEGDGDEPTEEESGLSVKPVFEVLRVLIQ